MFNLLPIFFNLVINDLNEKVEGTCISFADDTKLSGMSITPEDGNDIQNHLDNMQEWAENKRMKFSREKYSILSLEN